MTALDPQVPKVMKKAALVTIIFAAAVLLGQSAPRKWQSAHILEVKKQQDSSSAKSSDSSVERYAVSLRVNDTDYVVLYTPPPGVHGFQYTAGMDRLVLVESETITINDILGRPIKVPIISQKPAPQGSKP